MKCCAACGQEILLWHGVRLERQKAAIAQAIEGAPHGLSMERLVTRFYPGDDAHKARNRLCVLIWQINNEDMLECDWRLRRIDGVYRAVEEITEAA